MEKLREDNWLQYSRFMKAYLKTINAWDTIREGWNDPPLAANATGDSSLPEESRGDD